jgi:hypothetical protein
MNDLEALQRRAVKLGHQVEPRTHGDGYCRWQVGRGIGRTLVLSDEGGVSLDEIEKRLQELECQPKKQG